MKVEGPISAADLADADRRQAERRQGERRGMDGLRSNIQWTVASDRGRQSTRSKGWWRLRMKPSRIIPLVVALVAGGMAAYLATQREQPAVQPVAEVVQDTTARILVASQAIGVGQRLSSASLSWEEWPKAALRPDYITSVAAPTAISDMSGSVARSEFLPGDPIRPQKLARGADSFLPAILEGGKRGVSVAITAESASGGFVNPSDHVDVVLTRTFSASEAGIVTSQSTTILHNIQVLAIDSRLGPSNGTRLGQGSDIIQTDQFSGQAIATLALDAADAELIVNAAAIGKLSLLLRSAVDVAAKDVRPEDGANQAIRLSSPFWTR